MCRTLLYFRHCQQACRRGSPEKSESFRHVEVKQILSVDGISAQIQPDVHARLHFYTQSHAEVGKHPFDASGVGAHKAAARPGHISQVVDNFLEPVAAVRIEHLAIFHHGQVGRLVAILSHVVSSEVEGRSAECVAVQRDVAKCVFGLYGPCQHLSFTYGQILPVVQFQPVKFFIAAQKFFVKQSPDVQIYTAVGIGRDVTCIIGQQESHAGTDVRVSVGITAGCNVGRVLYHALGRFRKTVVAEIDLRSGKQMGISDAEEKLWIQLYALTAILTGTVTACVVAVRAVSYTVIVFQCIFIAELPHDAETVFFEKELGFKCDIDAAVEHIGERGRNHGTLERCIAGHGTEGHERAATDEKSEIRRVTRSAQQIVVKVAFGFLQSFQFPFAERRRAVIVVNGFKVQLSVLYDFQSGFVLTENRQGKKGRKGKK